MNSDKAGVIGGGVGGAIGGWTATQTSFDILLVGGTAAAGAIFGYLAYYLIESSD